MTGVDTVALREIAERVRHSYHNEIAEKRQARPPYTEEEIARVDGWLAPVSYREVLALLDECDRCDRLRAALGRIGEFASAHSGSDGHDVLLAALYRIAEECEAVL